jgi:hypothetical protein
VSGDYLTDAEADAFLRGLIAHQARPIHTYTMKPIPADRPLDQTLDEEPYFGVLYRGGGQVSRSEMKVYLWA